MKTPQKINRFSLLDAEWENDPGGKFATGKNPLLLGADELKEAGLLKSTPLKAIRARCRDCCGEQASEVRKCVAIDCPLWPFRMGGNPFQRKGGRYA